MTTDRIDTNVQYLWPGLHGNASPPPGGVPGGLRVGDLVFLSGQCAMDEAGRLIGADDCLAQAERCFDNIAQLLAASQLEMSNVVKLTCYLTRSSDYGAYAAAKRKWFPTLAPPGTCIVVAGLLLPGALIEIDAIAVASRR